MTTNVVAEAVFVAIMLNVLTLLDPTNVIALTVIGMMEAVVKVILFYMDTLTFKEL